MNATSTKQNIPKGWRTATIEDLCENLDNLRKPVTKSDREVGDIPYYGATGVVDYVKDYIFDESLLLVGEDGADWSKFADTAYLISGKSWVNNHAHVLRCENVNQVYLKEYLNYQDLNQYITGGTRGKLTKGILSRIAIVIPPDAEQKKIAEILSAVDEEIQKTDEIIAVTEKLKKGLVSELFSKYSDSQKSKIKDICEVTSSKRIMVSDYVDKGIPFYRSTEIIKKSKNIPVADPLYISVEKFNFFKNRFGAPEAGDLLITAVGTIGDVYLVQNEIFYFKDGNSVWLRKIKEMVIPEYLKMILSSNFYREKLNNIAGGSSQKALTIEKLENVEIPVPSQSEQTRLVEILSTVDKKISINKKIKEKLTSLKRGLMQDLLTGKVRTTK